MAWKTDWLLIIFWSLNWPFIDKEVLNRALLLLYYIVVVVGVERQEMQLILVQYILAIYLWYNVLMVRLLFYCSFLIKWIRHPRINILRKVDSFCYTCLIKTLHHSFALFLKIFVGLHNQFAWRGFKELNFTSTQPTTHSVGIPSVKFDGNNCFS